MKFLETRGMFRSIVAILCMLIFGLGGFVKAQSTTDTLTSKQFNSSQVINLSILDGWVFKAGHNSEWAKPGISTSDWEPLKPTELTPQHITDGELEGWFRITFTMDSTFSDIPPSWQIYTYSAVDLYINGERVQRYGVPNNNPEKFEGYNPIFTFPKPANLEVGKTHTLAMHLVAQDVIYKDQYYNLLEPSLYLTGPVYSNDLYEEARSSFQQSTIWLTILVTLSFLFLLLVVQNPKDKILKLIVFFTISLAVVCYLFNFFHVYPTTVMQYHLLGMLRLVITNVAFGLIPILISLVLNNKPLKWLYGFWAIAVISSVLCTALFVYSIDIHSIILVPILIGICVYLIAKYKSEIHLAQMFVIGGLVLTIGFMLLNVVDNAYNPVFLDGLRAIIVTGVYVTFPSCLLIYVAIRYNEILQETRQKAQEIVKLNEDKLKAEREKKELIEGQKEKLEVQVKERTAELEEAYEDLKISHKELQATQEQLVQQEKLASLGQLTAGIAHEIKNPLNFVNNFSDLSVELVEEAREELSAFSEQSSMTSEQVNDSLDILDDIEANLEKINEHGTRADGIVKSMLQHSRGGDGEMEPTDLNALIEEYVNLAFHGMRASEDPINVDIEMKLDENVGEIPLIAEDFSRVIINLCNNAFDAMRNKLSDLSKLTSDYSPKLTVRTSREDGQVTIEIEDNGPGIPEDVRDKILQPFFTTKKGTDGTGLGLSITNDIVKAHGGYIQIKSDQNGSVLKIQIPGNQ